jgi:para-nitrobenzyl esterase
MKSIGVITLFFCLFLFSCSSTKTLSNTISIGDGTVEGTIKNGIKSFKGIPYAATPVGNLRWKAPQPLTPWKGVLKADSFKPGSIQNQDLLQSEDCLYLNVWTQAKTRKDKLPVMVWIHGGGFRAGAPLENTYYGEKLTNKGVIYVSIAYRLGVLGFLAHPELSAESPNNVSGNYGLLDMIAALKWVKKNISAFENVTIFGESAGGIAVSILCGSSLAKDLFKGAICQSGGNFQPVNERSTLKGAEETGVDFAKAMGKHSIAELRQITNFKEFFDYKPAARLFGPTVDNYVLIGDQFDLYSDGKYNDINVLIGWNSDEGALFTSETEPGVFKNNIRERYGAFAEKFMSIYPGETKEQATRSSSEITRDMALGWGTWTWGKLQSRAGKSKVYMYYFDQKPPSTVKMPDWVFGAPHAAEIKYTLENINPELYGKNDLILSDIMGTYWTNFAKTGNPNGEDLPAWLNFTEKDQQVMYFKNTATQTPGMKPLPNTNKMELFDTYYYSIRKSK